MTKFVKATEDINVESHGNKITFTLKNDSLTDEDIDSLVDINSNLIKMIMRHKEDEGEE